MWARPLLFEMALYENNNEHPLHKRILGEWRGLLAILALKEWCDFPLKIETINISDEKNPADASDFLKSLQKLIPEDALDGETTWETLDILLFDDNPIGITSPTTLVCTSVNYSNSISHVPWYNGKFLDDPVHPIHPDSSLNPFEKAAVSGWLQNLYVHTQNLPVLDENNLKTNINRLLEAFMKDLEGGAAVAGGAAVIDFSENSLGFTQDLFRGMDKPVASQDLPSSIELVPSKDKKPEKTLLIFDRAIPKAWGEKPQNVIVWKGKTFANTQSFSGKPKLDLSENVQQPDPQKFFTDQLFVINQERSFHKNSTLVAKGSQKLNFNRVPVTPVLPITEELLTYLDVKDLNKRITFTQQNKSIVVKLSLTLSGLNGDNRDFEISKTYEAAKVKLISTAPVLSIWPNFKKPNWKAYYTYFSTEGQNTFIAKPYPVADGIEGIRTFRDREEKVEKEFTKTDFFPEAMLCEYKDAEAGIILIRSPEPVEKLVVDGTVWNVGVDFGTSSTTVYYTKGNADPKPIVFNKRLLHITATPTELEDVFYKDFVPSKSESVPFFSLFQAIGNNEKDEPILDGHIRFPCPL